MKKLLFTSREYFISRFITGFKNPRFLFPSSRFHSPTETLISNSKLGSYDEHEEHQSSTRDEGSFQWLNPPRSTARILHPWPEWMDLMENLSKKGYFEEGDGNPSRSGEMGAKEANRIRTACLNFSRDRFDLIRYFSRKDIEVVAGSGCPSIDRKVVNSGKRLRAHLDIDEGNVCSSCSLRGNCERAYVMAPEDEGRTVDLMRLLLTYGLDPIAGTLENELCRDKTIVESVRRLLKAMVASGSKELDSIVPNATSSKTGVSLQESSASKLKDQTNLPIKQGDWLCPKCNFLNFARNIKCLRCNSLFQERLRKLWEDQTHLPLKKGDWICDKCNFLNFAKNTRCLQCKEKPPKRQLNPGEWECDSCNYINFRRNMVCLKCDHRRPKASNSSEASAQPGHRNEDSFHHGGLQFIRHEDETSAQPPIRQEKQSPDSVAARWRFVEDESRDLDSSNSWNVVSGFVDFPIAGGKSDLSQNSRVKERWKAEMLNRSRNISRSRVNADESKSAGFRRRLEFIEYTSDEEMAEWFGCRMNEKIRAKEL